MAGTRGYDQVSVPNFGKGLDLRSQPGSLDPSAAIDLLNVNFSETGAVRQRDGYARFTPLALTNAPDSVGVFEGTDGTKRLLVGNGNRVDALDTNGQSVANTTAPTTSPHFFARFGGPTGERAYFGNGTDRIRRFAPPATFSEPVGLATVTGKFVAVWGNRLVVARQGGTTAGRNPSSVRFSANGDPEDFTVDTFADLHPGDGEEIMGLAVYGEQLIVFKESKFFVFYSMGTDASGNLDTSQWQPVASGIGLVASRAVCTARDGVYFLSRDGVYKTTGRAPEPVSGQVEPFFGGTTSAFFTSDTLNVSEVGRAAMCVHQQRIYLAVPTGVSEANDRMLVHDPRYGWWSLYDIPASCLASFMPGTREELLFGYAGTSKYVGRHSPAYSTDAGEYVPSVANYVENPSVETASTGYSASPGSASRLTSEGLYGTCVLNCSSGIGAVTVTAAIPGTSALPPSATYTASVWAKPLQTGLSGTLSLVEMTSAGATVGTTSTGFTLAPGWQRLTITRTFGATGVDASIVLSLTPDPITVYTDGWKLEAGAAATPYADGDSSGHAWAGTPHASQTLLIVASNNPVVSRCRLGFQDFGDPGMKRVRETRVWGEGRCKYRLTTDFQDIGADAAQTFSDGDLNDVWTDEPTDVWTDDPLDVWGGTRQITPRLIRQGRRGHSFSVEFSNQEAGVGFAVHRLDHHVADRRVPSVVNTEG